LHHEEHGPSGHGAEVHDVHDVLVPDHRRRPCLLKEAIDLGWIAAELLVEDLDRDLLAERDVDSTVDGTHAALAEQPLYAIAIGKGEPHQGLWVPPACSTGIRVGIVH